MRKATTINIMEHSKDFPDSFHRVTIKGLCVRDGKLLLIKEGENLSGKWELPGGGLDFGEDIKMAFEREIMEEMGLKVTQMSRNPRYVWTFKYENRRGLDWYYALVVAYRVEFEDLEFTPTDECQEIGFFSKQEMRDLGLEGQVTGLENIFDPTDFTEEF